MTHFQQYSPVKSSTSATPTLILAEQEYVPVDDDDDCLIEHDDDYCTLVDDEARRGDGDGRGRKAGRRARRSGYVEERPYAKLKGA
jgi:hypothetical protein